MSEALFHLRTDYQVGADPTHRRLVRTPVNGGNAWISVALSPEEWAKVRAAIDAEFGATPAPAPTAPTASCVHCGGLMVAALRCTRCGETEVSGPALVAAEATAPAQPAPDAATVDAREMQQTDAAAPSRDHEAERFAEVETLLQRFLTERPEYRGRLLAALYPDQDGEATEALALVLWDIHEAELARRNVPGGYRVLRFGDTNDDMRNAYRAMAHAAIAWAERAYGGRVVALEAVLAPIVAEVRRPAHNGSKFSEFFAAIGRIHADLLPRADAALALQPGPAEAAVHTLALHAYDASGHLNEIASWVERHEETCNIDPQFQRSIATVQFLREEAKALGDAAEALTTRGGGGNG